jgi:carbon storage regulator
MVVITQKKNVVITRKTNEGVVVGDDIFITVLEVRDDLVRLGIECPKETPFHQGV